MNPELKTILMNLMHLEKGRTSIRLSERGKTLIKMLGGELIACNPEEWQKYANEVEQQMRKCTTNN